MLAREGGGCRIVDMTAAGISRAPICAPLSNLCRVLTGAEVGVADDEH